MLKYLFLIFTTINLAYAQNNAFVQGEGRFWANDDDSAAFVRDQLVHQAFENVITKELENMGLSKELFWQKFDERFQTALEDIEEKLNTQYKVSEEALSGERLNTYNKTLRERKLRARAKFGNLERTIQSYTIKKITRSTQNPQSRYILVEARVNRVELNKIYHSYVAGKKKGEYSTLYIWVNYNLKNSTYADLGVDNEKDFTEVVNSFWMKWFNENKPANITNVEIIDRSKEARLKEYFKLPNNELQSRIPDIFVNSLLLEIDIEITKKGETQSFKEYEFLFSGGSYLLDLQTNKVLTSAYFEPVKQTYRDLEYKDLSTKVANFVYRMPFAEFTKMKTTLSQIANTSNTMVVRLIDFPNLEEVMKFSDLLENRGLKHSVSSSLTSFNSTEAELLVHFEGENEDLRRLVSAMKPVKSSSEYQIFDSNTSIGVKYSLRQGE